ncbi:hypothetical protein GFS31_15100 [Leptolyngbya sp. BL0902]|nr:hypothetical protein GFS31_15100 [Leptolyngbya sp. BL0902]
MGLGWRSSMEVRLPLEWLKVRKFSSETGHLRDRTASLKKTFVLN